MAFQTPRTWTTSELVTAAMMNQDVRDNISFLANPPACRVYNNANISINDATITTVTFNSERFDTDSMHSTSSNTSRITFNTAGIYVVSFSFVIAAAADYNQIFTAILLNGTTRIASVNFQSPPVNTNPEMTYSTIYKFPAASYIEALVYHDNTANAARNLLNNHQNSPEFSATWIGLG